MRSSKNRIAIITVNYNSPEDTRRCVESFSSLDTKDLETHFFVVNNGCNGRSNEFQSEWSKKCTVIQSLQNLGFAGGNNIAIRQAIKEGFDYLLLINNDAWVEDRCFFKSLLASPFDLSSATITTSGSEHKKDFGGVVDWYFGRNHHVYQLQRIDYLSGACLFARSSVFQKAGLLDDRFFLYYEDVDFCLRVTKLGYSLGIVPEISILHDLSSSTNRLGRQKLRILANSHLRFCLRHLNPMFFPLYFFFNLYLRFKAFFL